MRALHIAGRLLALALTTALAAGVARAETACGPFDATSDVLVEDEGMVHDPGIVPSRRAAPTGGGPIVSIPAAGEPPRAGRIAGEALLALPVQPDGSLPTDYELAPGARMAESFFSSVLCATVVRVVGPPDTSPQGLVPVLPADALVVPHHRYVTPADPGEPVEAERQGPDPYLSLQFGLTEVGALEARSVTRGADVTVAVLDTAPDAGHPELARVRVDALPGGPSADPSVHGTLITGVIAAVEGNAFGIAGVAPAADVVAIPVCSAAGATASSACRLYDVLRGIERAWEVAAAILNLSIVGQPNPLLGRAMERLNELGPVVVAAAGNGGTADPRYPAAYPAVIGVGAFDAAGDLYARGNRGTSVQILAPGAEILSTMPGGAFAFGDGTSLAAAHVTGALALLTSVTGDAARARAELLRAGAELESPLVGAARIPRACDVLAQLGRPCPPPAGSAQSTVP